MDFNEIQISRYVNTGDTHTFRPTFQYLKFACSHNFGGHLLSKLGHPFVWQKLVILINSTSNM